METSVFFRNALYLEQSPAAADYFEERNASLFVSDASQSWVEVTAISSRDVVDGRTSKTVDEANSLVSHHKRHVERTELDPDFTNSPTRSKQTDFTPESSLCLQRASLPEELRRLIAQQETGRHNRIFIIRQRNSLSRLNITRPLFECLLSGCGVFPQFKDFILCFGTKKGENEVGPPRLRFRSVADELSQGAATRGFECAYVLRYVELNHRGNEESPWSLRQTAFYHKFDKTTSTSSWIYVAISSRAQTRLEAYFKANDNISALNPFEIHLLLLDSAMANWRPYLVDLAAQTNSQADRVVAASIDDNGLIRITDFDERQRLKQIEDNMLDLLIILDSTLDTVSSLIETYSYSSTQEVLGQLSGLVPDRDPILLSLSEKRRDVLLYRSKVDSIKAKVQGTTELVSSLLDLGNGHSLKVLAEQARVENVTMRELTEKGFRDAVAIKVLTIVTLVYLPATVVSNFFSTQFVSQVKTDNSAAYLVVASNWWIFVAVSVPLTIATLYVWWFYVQKQAYGEYPYWYRTIRSATIDVAKRMVGGRDHRQRSEYVAPSPGSTGFT